jgi:hypothetical protein
MRDNRNMTDGTRKTIRLVVSAFMTGIVGAGTNVLTAVTSSGEIPKSALVIASIAGIVLTAKNIESSLSEPPRG